MQIKIIKKGEPTQAKETTHFQAQGENKVKKVERKLESNIMSWISDLRERKNLEFAQTQVLLSSLR